MATIEVPKDITEKYGSEGDKVFTKGAKAGEEIGKGVAQDPFSKEVQGKVTSVLNAKKKDGYKAKTVEELAKVVPFKIGEALPDRAKLMSFLSACMNTIEGMPLPPKTVKAKTEPTS